MSKISVDLRPDWDNREQLISSEQLVCLTTGCLETTKRLEKLGRTIEAFRVTFVQLRSDKTQKMENGPSFSVHFCDPLGNKCSHTSDFRFMGTGGPTPTAQEIADHLAHTLPKHIREHLCRCETQLQKAAEANGRLLAS